MSQPTGGPDPRVEQALLACVAGHFEGAEVGDGLVRMAGSLWALRPWLNALNPWGPATQASLFLEVLGPRFGPEPILVTTAGYSQGTNDDALNAVVQGACNWCCVFGPLLRELHGEAVGSDEGVDGSVLSLNGGTFRLLLDGIDRAVSTDGRDAGDRPERARQRLGGTPFLVPSLLESGLLPALPSDRVSLVSAFVWSMPTGRTFEVKVNGVQVPRAEASFEACEAEPEGAVSILRELAFLDPLSSG